MLECPECGAQFMIEVIPTSVDEPYILPSYCCYCGKDIDDKWLVYEVATF